MKKHYDYIIAGGGCSGMSLLYHLLHSSLKDASILVLDNNWHDPPGKTWCFWNKEPYPYLSAQKTSWDILQYKTDKFTQTQDVAPYQYYYIDSKDFFQEIRDLIQQFPNVVIAHEEVIDIKEENHAGVVTTMENEYISPMVFNSIPPNIPDSQDQYYSLKQHFLGWFIETEIPTFEKDKITFMDFRVPQYGEARFMYVLPFSETQALVEYTLFSESLISREEYQQELQAYLEFQAGFPSYRVMGEEYGVIPMTDYPFQQHRGRHIINLGTAGGFTKASTGYTFKNIQADVKAIVASLEASGSPHYQRKQKKRFSWYDTLLLHIILNKGQLTKAIFDVLFRKNDIRLILRFLDEETKWWEDIYILTRLPWMPFLQALWEHYVLGRVKTKKPGPEAIPPSPKPTIPTKAQSPKPVYKEHHEHSLR